VRCVARGSPLAGCHAAALYGGHPATWIQLLKYRERGTLGLDPTARGALMELVEALAVVLSSTPADLVIPVPLHPARLRERGFNPSTWIARALAHRAGVPVATDRLIRVRDTPSQTGLGERARRRNVARAFACTPASRPLPERIWLIDDVITTGSTLESAAEALLAGGARRITGVSLAATRPAG